MLSKDSDVSRCAFSSSDGRQCRMLRSARSRYCLHHERQFRYLDQAEQLADELFAPISRGFVTAASLSQSMARLFAAVAAGRIGPKSAAALSRVAETLLKSILVSSEEFESAFKNSQWRKVVRSSIGNLSEFSVPVPALNSAKSAGRSDSRKDQPEETLIEGDASEDSQSLPSDPAEFINQLAREL